jgi:hypothetical protein
MRNWLATQTSVRPSVIWLAASELLFCVALRNEVNWCDGSVIILPVFAGIVGLLGYTISKLAFRTSSEGPFTLT